MRRWLTGWLLAIAASGQNAPPAPSFDVAEIRVNVSGPGASHGDISNGRLVITNIPLRYLVAEAWMIDGGDVYGPSWLDDVRVDVVAKTTSPATPDAEVRHMLQTLLKERMKLVAHIEQREKAVWALAVWKGKPKMTPSEMPAKPEDGVCSSHGTSSGTLLLSCKHLTMAQLAHRLPGVAAAYADKPVVDQTGLGGAWDFTLEWTPLKQLEDKGGLTLFAALQAQLGLQLESRKLPVSVVVVDSMERAPTDN
jgi:uncharacterized protein (TIGR03435 family)